MSKEPNAFRTISEVAEELNVPQHVLRFWETRFTQIRPVKRGGGRRFYRPDDIALLQGIRHLLYGSGYTIRGVQRILAERGVAHVQGLLGNFAVSSLNEQAPSPLFDAQSPGQEMEEAGAVNLIQTEERLGTSPYEAVEETHGQAFSSSPSSSSDLIPSENVRRDALYPSEALAYAPGPLSRRPSSSSTQGPQGSFDRLISADYRLSNETREQLRATVDELKECRRLLATALSHQAD